MLIIYLHACFKNIFRLDATTEGDEEFSFFEALHPGVVIRVNATNEIQIALTTSNITSNPMIEIFIGEENNTRSTIRLNQETNVVTLPTPNIIERDQWNDFRITWSYRGIFVYRGNAPFPLMYFYMQEYFPINYYGVRAV